MRFGHDILVFHRNNRNIQSNHLTGFARKIARRADNMFTGDFTLISRHLPCTSGGALNRCHGCIAVYFSPTITCPACQCLSQVSWLDIAIIWMPNPTNQPISVAHWPIMFDFVRCQDLHIDTNRAGNPSILPIFIHTVSSRGKPDVRYIPKTDIHAGFFL